MAHLCIFTSNFSRDFHFLIFCHIKWNWTLKIYSILGNDRTSTCQEEKNSLIPFKHYIWKGLSTLNSAWFVPQAKNKEIMNKNPHTLRFPFHWLTGWFIIKQKLSKTLPDSWLQLIKDGFKRLQRQIKVKDRNLKHQVYKYLHPQECQKSTKWGCPSIAAWSKCYPCKILHLRYPTLK